VLEARLHKIDQSWLKLLADKTVVPDLDVLVITFYWFIPSFTRVTKYCKVQVKFLPDKKA